MLIEAIDLRGLGEDLARDSPSAPRAWKLKTFCSSSISVTSEVTSTGSNVPLFGAGIDHQLANDFRTARGYVADTLQLIERRRSFGKLRLREFGESKRSSKQVVEVMRDSACEHAQALQILALVSFFLRLH